MTRTAHENRTGTEIAIVGMAGRFPGCSDIEQFWSALRSGKELLQPYSDEQLRAAGVDAGLLSDPAYVKAGGTLEGVDLFDAPFFAVGPKDAAIMDPQHRHFLECSWTALEHAGHTSGGFPGSIGVFAGCGMNAYFMSNVMTNPDLVDSTGMFLLRHTGNDRDFLPTGVSYKMNLRGPSVAVQTACSTSLVAVHLACQSLLGGECDMALAGGVTILVPHGQGYLYRPNEILSPDGHCRPFDARSGGTVISSGAGVVVLRRLTDAMEDGDTIHAVIRSSAVNNDGAGKIGYLAPSVEGHAHVVTEALELASLRADDLSYVEAHGTGTAMGDPVELAALTQAFRRTTDRKRFCRIGSVKSNVGHLDTAAGVAGLIKVVESLKHGEIPASLHFESPNPAIDFGNSPFVVNASLASWPRQDQPRRAGISSLGVGGTNAHVVLEEAPTPAAPATPRQWEILPVSAHTPAALDRATENLSAHLQAAPGTPLEDAAFTLQSGRVAMNHRRIAVCSDARDAGRILESKDARRLFSGQAGATEPSVVFMFPGGGAQHPGMGRRLYEAYPVFQAEFDRCLELFSHHVEADLRGLIFPAAGREATAAAGLEEPCASVCAVFSVEYALAKLWMSWGIAPAAMTGHSLGEYVAACLAGVMSLEEAAPIVALRGRLVGSATGSAMLSVPLSEEELLPLLGDDLDLAAVNAPSMCVISGREDRLREIEARLSERELECRKLPLAGASHTRLLDPVLDEFRQRISKVALQAPRIPYVSNVTGTWIRSEDARDPEYWVRHFRRTVRFSQGLGELLRDPGRILLEVGPGQTLSSLARQQPVRAAGVVASMRRADDSTDDEPQFLTAFGRLWTYGVGVDWSKVQGDRRQRIPLPTYPFERHRFWIEPGVSSPGEARKPKELRRLERIEEWFYRTTWSRVDAPAASAEARKEPILVFLDSSGIGGRLAEKLRKRGETVVTVQDGDALTHLSEYEYALAPEAGREGYSQLLKELSDRNLLPRRIAHLWMVTEEESAGRVASFHFHRKMERGFYSLLFLAQALAEVHPGAPVDLAVMSNGMQSVNGEPLPCPEKATILGPIRVIPREFPNVTCNSIDIDLPKGEEWISGVGADRDPLERLTDQLLAELASLESGPVVALRGEDRWKQIHERRPSPPREGTPSLLRNGGTYLITGGWGGIGLALARHLASTRNANLVLIGRTPIPPEKEWEGWLASHGKEDPVSRIILKCRDIQAQGATVLALSADVSDLDGMKACLARSSRTFGPFHGVFHAAGGLEEGVISAKTMDSIERVFSSKIYGTQVLVELLSDMPLDFLALFSSTSSLLGPPGQVDYVAANTFMNAIAQSRTQRAAGKTIAVNWGVWKDVGMAAALSSRLRGETEEAEPPREPTLHSLLGDRIRNGKNQILFESVLSPRKHWVLDEHRTGAGQAIVPGTAYLEIARAAAEHAGLSGQVEVRDLSLLTPLTIGDDEEARVRVALDRRENAFDFEIRSRTASGDSGPEDWDLHAKGTLSAGPAGAGKQLSLEEIDSRCSPPLPPNQEPQDALLRQERFLTLGPRWKAIRRMSFGRHEALAELHLHPDYHPDLDEFKLHPAILDLATGFALPLIKGYDRSDALYVPMSYSFVRIHAPLPSRLFSHVRSGEGNTADRDVAIFDVHIADERGRVLAEVEQFALKKVARASEFGSTGGRKASPNASFRKERPLPPGERMFLATYEAGIEPGDGMKALELLLNTNAHPQEIVTSIDLQSLMEHTRAAASGPLDSGIKFSRPSLHSSFEGPRNEVERALAGFWEDLLGIETIGIHDDFFELGGHSLIAARLFAKIRKTWGLEYPISTLFQGPTIAQCAEIIGADLSGKDGVNVPPGDGKAQRRHVSKHRFLVPLNTDNSGDPLPFFFVGGMYGNVLNLRHLASHLGKVKPVYALQARGLLGDDRPHERFEDMARDYLKEVRSIQPKGPYYLGGFSGGGISALEMAQQLKEAGEETAILVMLDSFPPDMPQLTWRDWLKIRRQALRQLGVSSIGSGLSKLILRGAGRMRRMFRKPALPETSTQFRSQRIQEAFRAAVANYRPREYGGKVMLFRPPIEEAHVLGPGRIVNSRRKFEDLYNHWGPYVPGGIEAHIVTGDHLGMVLEPHVRAIAERIKEHLARTSAPSGQEVHS